MTPNKHSENTQRRKRFQKHARSAVAAVVFAAGSDWAGAIASLSSFWFSIRQRKRPVSGVAPHQLRRGTQ
jgi:hypothetical protein